MAYAYYTYNVYQDGKIVNTGTYRVTYTITNYDAYSSITCTKLENKYNSSGSSVYSGTNPIKISYWDASDSYNYDVDTGLRTNNVLITTNYVTLWSGSKTFTSYRRTAESQATFHWVPIPIPALPSYTVSYSAPGAEGIPSTQTKYYGKTLYLASGSPTKPGYSFVNWLSSYDSKYYASNSSYTANAASVMTAQWRTNTYTVSYDANGGSGVVPSQSKTYDSPLNFQTGTEFSNKDIQNGITREHVLLKWNSQPDGSGDEYTLGSAIPNITNDLKVYAIWELRYLYPYINNLQAYRTATASISDKDRASKGEYIYISFDFVGSSNDKGINYNIPNCKITIDEDEYTPTLTFDTDSHSGSAEFKANVIYSIDNPHNVTVELTDPVHSTSTFRLYDYITTSIYPIDLFDNPDTNKVYMGIMHPYTENELLTIPETFIDGEMKMHLDIDANASKTTPAVSGEDKNLFNTILDNEWYDDVIDSNGRLLLKKQLWKTSEPSSEPTPPTPIPEPTPITFTYRSNNYFPSDRINIWGYKWCYLTVIYIYMQSSVSLPSGSAVHIGTIPELAEPGGSYTFKYSKYVDVIGTTYTGHAQLGIMTNGVINIDACTRSELWADSRIKTIIPIITTF